MSEVESIYIACSSGINPHSDVLCARRGDTIRLLGQAQMDFSLDDARRLANTILDLLDDSSDDSLVDDVCADFKARSRIGQQKYGTKMTREDLSLVNWLHHLKSELMDAVLYGEAALRKLELMEDDGK